jgi:hypothetical protein
MEKCLVERFDNYLFGAAAGEMVVFMQSSIEERQNILNSTQVSKT